MNNGAPKNNSETTDAEVKNVAMEILQYFEKHPRSQDTLEGIRRWWLENGIGPVPAARVEKALDWLIRHHVVVKKLLPDGGAVFASTKNTSSNDRTIN